MTLVHQDLGEMVDPGFVLLALGLVEILFQLLQTDVCIGETLCADA
jgi:hypothetical protein